MANPEVQSCGVDPDTHLKMVALALLDVDVRCPETYKALVEYTDFIKRYHGFPEHQPTMAVERLIAEEKMLLPQSGMTH